MMRSNLALIGRNGNVSSVVLATVMFFVNLFAVSSVSALTLTYNFLQSNATNVQQNYGTVTVTDGVTVGTDTAAIKFTVTANADAYSCTTPPCTNKNFGIDKFGFNIADGNGITLGSANIVDASGMLMKDLGWKLKAPGNQSGFGFFDVTLRNGSSSGDLEFYITGIAADTAADYFGYSSKDIAYAAHIKDFSDSSMTDASHFVATVPIPAAIVLFISGLVGVKVLSRRNVKKSNGGVVPT